jgi:hypothetical protein
MTQHDSSSNGMSMAKVLFAILAALALALTMGLAMSQAADAAAPKPGIIRKAIDLTPTPTGRKIAAEGVAEIRQKTADGLQEFAVDMETVSDATGKPTVAEGTPFRVFVTNSHPRFKGKNILAGRIVIDDKGMGLLELSNDPLHIAEGAQRITAGVKPVTKIRTVTVKDSSGEVILKGSF